MDERRREVNVKDGIEQDQVYNNASDDQLPYFHCFISINLL